MFRQAIENSANYAQAHVNLALTLAGRGDFAAARPEFEQALAQDPGNAKALTATRDGSGPRGRSRAVETFRKVVALDPASPQAHLNLGIALADTHQTEAALAEFSEAIRLAPQSGQPHYNKGRLLGEIRRFDEAIAELREACRLEPGFADSYYRLGLAEREAGDNLSAAEALRKALDLNPQNAEAAYLLGQSLQSLGKPGEAAEAWSKALAINPGNTQALYSLMRAYQKSDPKRAAEYQSRLKSLEEQKGLVERAQTLDNSGITAARRGDWETAISQMREALDFCAGCSLSPKLRKNLALTECQAGRFTDCEKDMREALGDLPDDAEIQKALEILANMKRQ